MTNNFLLLNSLFNGGVIGPKTPTSNNLDGCSVDSSSSVRNLMALFHCMVRHGTVRYGSLLGGFPLGTVPGT